MPYLGFPPGILGYTPLLRIPYMSLILVTPLFIFTGPLSLLPLAYPHVILE